MLAAKIIVKNVDDYKIISKLTEYSIDDKVIVDLYDRVHVTVPSVLFVQCLNMLYSSHASFEIIKYLETTN